MLIKYSYLQVADFGLTKLTEVGSSSLPTGRLVGTFGYMPPEYDNLCSFNMIVVNQTFLPSSGVSFFNENECSHCSWLICYWHITPSPPRGASSLPRLNLKKKMENAIPWGIATILKDVAVILKTFSG